MGLPVGSAAFIYALVQGGADLLGDGVGGFVQCLWVGAFVHEVAHGADGYLLCCGEHFGSVGSVAGQDAVDIEHHQLKAGAIHRRTS